VNANAAGFFGSRHENEIIGRLNFLSMIFIDGAERFCKKTFDKIAKISMMSFG
jgi:hypothetical protein